MNAQQQCTVQHFYLSLLHISSGNKWHLRRKQLTQAFHYKILDNFIGVFDSQACKLVEKLRVKADGDPFDVYPYFTLCALDIICGKCKNCGQCLSFLCILHLDSTHSQSSHILLYLKLVCLDDTGDGPQANHPQQFLIKVACRGYGSPSRRFCLSRATLIPYCCIRADSWLCLLYEKTVGTRL